MVPAGSDPAVLGHAGSGRGVGDKEGELQGATLGGESGARPVLEGILLIFLDTCGGGELDFRSEGGEGLLAGRP